MGSIISLSSCTLQPTYLPFKHTYIPLKPTLDTLKPLLIIHTYLCPEQAAGCCEEDLSRLSPNSETLLYIPVQPTYHISVQNKPLAALQERTLGCPKTSFIYPYTLLYISYL